MRISQRQLQYLHRTVRTLAVMRPSSDTQQSVPLAVGLQFVTNNGDRLNPAIVIPPRRVRNDAQGVCWQFDRADQHIVCDVARVE